MFISQIFSKMVARTLIIVNNEHIHHYVIYLFITFTHPRVVLHDATWRVAQQQGTAAATTTSAAASDDTELLSHSFFFYR